MEDKIEAPVRLYLATAAGAGRIGGDHATSVEELVLQFLKRGWDITIDRGSMAGVDRTRNIAVANARKTDMTHFMFIDSGTVFSAASVLNMIDSGFDVIGAGYPMKSLDFKMVAEAVRKGLPDELLGLCTSRFVFNASAEQMANPIKTKFGNFYEMNEVGTAFLLIKRHVLDKYIRHYHDQIAYVTDYKPVGDTHHLVFQCERDPTQNDPSGRYLTEDFAFCARWRMMGGKVHCYADAMLETLGSYMYKGCLALSMGLERVEKDVS